MVSEPFITIKEVNPNDTSIHFQKELNIYWQLTGFCRLFSSSSQTVLNADELFLISPYQPYNIQTLNGKAILLTLDLSYFDTDFLTSHHFFQRPATNESACSLKVIFAQLFDTLGEATPYGNLKIRSLTYQLLFELMNHFTVAIPADTGKQSKPDARIIEILTYLNEHSAEKITLGMLSQRFYITTSYLSQYFHSIMRITFKDYLKQLRLNHAFVMLASTTETIEAISMKTGFSSIHAFSVAFASKYGMNPSKYRKSILPYSRIETPDNHEILSQYLHPVTHHSAESKALNIRQELLHIDFSAKGKVCFHRFLKILNGGNAWYLLKSSMQKLLAETMKSIRFESLYISRLLDDNMNIYLEERDGTPFLNFRNLDYLCDFLFSLNLNPVFELSYMPRRLADTINMPNLMENDIVSMPKDMEKWCFLIKGTAEHIAIRYGQDRLNSCEFSVWSTPDNPLTPFSLPMSSYFELFYQTWNTLKTISPKIQVGVSKLTYTQLEKQEWIQHFLAFCRNRKCAPDYIGWNFYAVDKNIMQSAVKKHQLPLPSLSPDVLTESITNIDATIQKEHFKPKKYLLTDWNFSFSSHPLNDTVFRAIYIIRNVCRHLDTNIVLNCSELSDLSATPLTASKEYHGWYGLYTYHGIPKPSYYAYQMLSMLGNTLLSRGENWCITRRNNEIQILLFHYQHFQKTSDLSELFPQEEELFDFNQLIHIQCTLENLPFAKYSRLTTQLSRHSGSSYNHWHNMGSPEIQKEELTQYLVRHSSPHIHSDILMINNGMLQIDEKLYPLEAKMMIMTPV